MEETEVRVAMLLSSDRGLKYVNRFSLDSIFHKMGAPVWKATDSGNGKNII